MSNQDHDLLRYTVIPTLDVATMVTLATELLHRVPDAPAPGVRKAARKVRTSLEALRAGWHEPGQAPAAEGERRVADLAADSAWSALQRRMAAYAQLPHERYPEAIEAAQLGVLLFPDGLRFLTLPWKAQWAEGDKRLRQIDEQGLAAAIERLAGRMFLDEIRRTHEAYGKVLGVSAPLPEAPAPATLGEPLLELRRALKRYAVQVVATADEDSADSVRAVERALAPIEEARVARPRPAAKEQTPGG